MTQENQIESRLIKKLEDLKYTYRPDICDRKALEQNFRDKFETLNRIRLTDSEFARLHDGIVNADVFTAAKTLRERNTFQREDGTPLQYTLVNIKDWCKNEFEIINTVCAAPSFPSCRTCCMCDVELRMVSWGLGQSAGRYGVSPLSGVWLQRGMSAGRMSAGRSSAGQGRGFSPPRGVISIGVMEACRKVFREESNML